MNLRSIFTQKDAGTESTDSAIHQLIDYVATYPNGGIIYCASDMNLCAHSDADYLNESKTLSQAVSFIFLSEDDPIHRINGPVITLPKIIKFVMYSAAEAELAGLFITAKNTIPLCQTLIEMSWPQPKLPIKTDKSTTVGVTNRKVVAKKINSIDMRIWWLQCREYQGQIRFYWASESIDEADYPTKHHPDIYHEMKRQLSTFS